MRDQRKVREWSADRWRRNRAEGIELLGGVCVECGGTDRLNVDHIDPRTKTSSNFWSWSHERRMTELAKCQLLCWPHHRKKSLDDLRKHLEGVVVVDRWTGMRPKKIDRYEVFS